MSADGLPMPPSTMSEATIALGNVMHHLPAGSVEIDSKMGIRIVARTEAGFLRWASMIHAEQLDSSADQRTATGVMAHIPATVIFHLDQIGAAS